MEILSKRLIGLIKAKSETVKEAEKRGEIFTGSPAETPVAGGGKKNESKMNPEINRTEEKVVKFIESITDDVEQVKNACGEFKKMKMKDNESFGDFVGRISNPFIKGYLEKNDKIAEIKEMKVKEVFNVIEKYIKGKEK